MIRRELVGPVRQVYFQYGARAASVNYDTPANTLDQRYVLCTDHHVACDCREAELAERIAEYRAMIHDFKKACDEILAGHPTGSSYYPATTNCQCSGCRIARAAHYYPEGSLT